MSPYTDASSSTGGLFAESPAFALSGSAKVEGAAYTIRLTNATYVGQGKLWHHGSLLTVGGFEGTALTVPLVSKGNLWGITVQVAGGVQAPTELFAPVMFTTNYDYLLDRVLSRELEEAEREVSSRLSEFPAEELEDGMTLQLAEMLFPAIEKYGESAVVSIASIISAQGAPPEVLSHALRWLGRIKHDRSFSARLWLLARGLKSSSAMIRDGAALGLVALGTPLGVPSLRTAAINEELPVLKSNLAQALARLERKTRADLSQKG